MKDFATISDAAMKAEARFRKYNYRLRRLAVEAEARLHMSRDAQEWRTARRWCNKIRKSMIRLENAMLRSELDIAKWAAETGIRWKDSTHTGAKMKEAI